MCTCPLGRSRRPFACSSDTRHAHGVFNNRYSYTSSYASARGQSDCQKTTRNGLLPRFWGSQEQQIRHVARMADHADRFLYHLYMYRCISQLLIAPLGALHGMLHGMRRHGESPHVWCPQTPFWQIPQLPGNVLKRWRFQLAHLQVFSPRQNPTAASTKQIS